MPWHILVAHVIGADMQQCAPENFGAFGTNARLPGEAPSLHLRGRLRARRGRARRLFPHSHGLTPGDRRCRLSILCALNQSADLRRRALALQLKLRLELLRLVLQSQDEHCGQHIP